MKKFELTSETKTKLGIKLFRIKRLSNGEMGGWVEKEENLSQEDNAWVEGNAWVVGNARVEGNADYLLIGPIGSRWSMLTAFREEDGGVKISTGCYIGTISEFKKAVKDKHGASEHGKNYMAAIKLIEKWKK